MSTTTPLVSVFGSSAPAPGSPDYERARRAGKLLAEAGFSVQTGGYGGTMAAVSQGAREAGGHVVGVTCQSIEVYRAGARANDWVVEEQRHDDLQGRLRQLVEGCAGALVLPGGPGTLAELALMWNLVLIGELPRRPIVLVGELWARTLESFAHPDYLAPEHRALVRVEPGVDEAVARLTARLLTGARGR